ncbi:sugar transport protein 13-like [Castanea sativa]|uniref:sugar transport protein 13-like n=1 Tax=Castanea sativa TaxID=21020 RepID=UPI003F6526CA
MANFEWGWRICFAIPRVLVIPPLLISIFAHDTPMYYIEMKSFRKARREFTKTRGDGFNSKFEQLKEESLGAWSSLEYVFSRQCRPYLVITGVQEICLQLSRMFAIGFFLPTLLMKFDISAYASYLASMVYEYVNIFASLIVLLLKGHYSVLYPTRSEAYRFFGFLLTYSLGYGVTSSKWIKVDFPRRASSTAGPMMMSIIFSIMFVMTYALLPMICSMKGGLFVLFTVIVICMLVFIYLLVPESSDIPEEEMNEKVWRKHWFWRSYMAPEERLSTSGVEMIGGENENNGSCVGNSGVEKVGTNGGDCQDPNP